MGSNLDNYTRVRKSVKVPFTPAILGVTRLQNVMVFAVEVSALQAADERAKATDKRFWHL